MKEIQLTKGKVALVDDEDFEYLNQFKWYASRAKNGFYVHRALKGINRKQIKTSIHRVIMKAEKGIIIDHVDGNGLNNQKNNLRICTLGQNQMNRGAQLNNKSGFKGVHYFNNTTDKNWIAKISYNKKIIYLGSYSNPIDAARAYNEAAIKYHGEFANLNKID
jgi:hypothetical protein